MTIRISSPEILIAGSCSLLIFDQIIAGWVFFALGVFGAALRVSIDAHFQQVAAKKQQDTLETGLKMVSGLLEVVRIRSEDQSENSRETYN